MNDSSLPPVQLGPIAELGYTCNYEVAGPTSLCGRAGEFHILWPNNPDSEVAASGIACNDHFRFAVHHYAIESVHRLEAVCSAPGSIWIKPHGDESLSNPSKCTLPNDAPHTTFSRLFSETPSS